MENKLLTIYGCKESKDKRFLVLTFVRGEKDNKQYFNACVSLAKDTKKKVKAKIEKEYGIVAIPLLKEKDKTAKDEKSVF